MRTKLVLLAVALTSAACTMTGPRFDMSSIDREKVQRQYIGRDFVLASSMYVSDFFGEKDRLFADPRPFEIIELFHESGSPVVIGLASETIVPAGTPVVVKQIIYPLDALQGTFKTQGSELLPTGHPWVVVERTDPAASKTPLVIVLPRQLNNVEQFTKAFQDRLKSQQWVTTWLTQRDPSILDGIFRKQVVAGMTWVDVVAALGEPKNVSDKSREMTAFVADYGDIQVTVGGNIVNEVKSLKAEAAVAAKQAQEAADAARVEADKKRAEEDARRVAADEAKKKAEEEGAKARAEIMAKAEAERAVELAKKDEDKKKLAVEEEKLRKEAELKARMDAATKAKEDAQTDKERRIKEAELAKQVAKAEAEALAARKQADKEAAKAEAEALVARKALTKQLAAVEADAQKARKKAEIAENDAASLKEKLEAQRQDVERQSFEMEGPRKLGAKVQPISLQLAGALGLANTNGAFIGDVAADGEGARAGLKANDIVLDVDGKEVTDPKSFVELVGATDKTRSVALGVFRGGKKLIVKLEAAATTAKLERDKAAIKKGETELAAKEKAAASARADADTKARAVAKVRADFMKKHNTERRKLGIKVEAVSEQLAAALALPGKGGAYVVEVRPDTEAARAGLEKNDVVLRVNGVPIDNPDTFTEVVGNTLPVEAVELEVMRKGKKVTVSVAGDPNAAVKLGGATAPASAAAPGAATAPAGEGRGPVTGGRTPPDPRKLEMTDAPAEGEGDGAKKPVPVPK